MTDEDPAVAAWRGLLVAHSRLVPAIEADLRAAGQVPLSWYDVLLELNAAPGRRLRALCRSWLLAFSVGECART